MKTFPLGLSYDDVLLIPQKSEAVSRNQVDLTTEIAPNFFLKIPILATKMDTVTGVEMAVAISKYGGLALMPRFSKPEKEADAVRKVKEKNERVFASVGIRDDCITRAELCVRAGADGLILDVAHGHMTKALEFVSKLKNRFPNLPLISGIAATYEAAYDIFSAGADAVSVGVGASPICTTRIMTGCGVPAITSLLEAVRASKKFRKKFVITDAGVKNSGDLVKTLATGASGAICGFILAGTDEAPGEIIKRDGKLYKAYNGSTSETQKHRESQEVGAVAPHFKLHVEGVEGLVPYKGPLKDHLDRICAGVRSGFSYCGARNVRELWKKAQFMQITAAGLREGQAHDIISP